MLLFSSAAELEGEDDVEYDNTPDALDVAEQAMRERKRGGGTSRKRRRGESSSARRRPSRQAVREEDEDGHAHQCTHANQFLCRCLETLLLVLVLVVPHQTAPDRQWCV